MDKLGKCLRVTFMPEEMGSQYWLDAPPKPLGGPRRGTVVIWTQPELSLQRSQPPRNHGLASSNDAPDRQSDRRMLQSPGAMDECQHRYDLSPRPRSSYGRSHGRDWRTRA